MITIKEEFVGCAKWRRAIKLGGADAILMWLALKRYVHENLTDGFVPDEEIESLPGAPKNTKKAINALVQCGALESDGARGAGLLDRAEHGWRLHDFEDHANSSTEEELRREKERERKRKWRAEQARLLEAIRAGQEPDAGRDSPAGQDGTTDGTVPRDKTGQRTGRDVDLSAGPRPRARTCPPAGARTGAPTQPNLTKPEEISPAAAEDLKDLTGSAHEEPPEESAATAAPAIPRNLTEALTVPICERAKLVDSRPDLAQWLQPEAWPEVKRLVTAFEEATGKPSRRGAYDRDGGIRALVALYAVGYMPSDLERAIRAVVASEWWTKGGAVRGLQSFSIEVVERAQHAAEARPLAAASPASKWGEVVNE